MNIRELPRQIFDELATERPQEVTEGLVAEFTRDNYKESWDTYWSLLDRPALLAKVGEAAMLLEEKTAFGDNFEDDATTTLIVYPSFSTAIADPIDSQCGHLVARASVRRNGQDGALTLTNTAGIHFSNNKIEALKYSQKQSVLAALGAITSRTSELYTQGAYSSFEKHLHDL